MAICPIEPNGWCPLHKQRHVGHLRTLSQRDDAKAEQYRRYWDTLPPDPVPKPMTFFQRAKAKVKSVLQRLACAGKPKPASRPAQPPLLLGDAVEQALAKVGVTKERVSAWLGRPCGCKERQDKLNALHLWARKVLSGERAAPPMGE